MTSPSYTYNSNLAEAAEFENPERYSQMDHILTENIEGLASSHIIRRRSLSTTGSESATKGATRKRDRVATTRKVRNHADSSEDETSPHSSIFDASIHSDNEKDLEIS